MCDHGHSHGGHGHSHGAASCAQAAVELDSDLYPAIDFDKLVILNDSGEGQDVLRPYEDRNDRSKFLTSDEDDDELLIRVQFSRHVKVTAVVLISDDEDDESRPTKLRFYKDRDNMSFDDASIKADFEVEVAAGEVRYALPPSRFNSCAHLTIHVPGSAGGRQTRIEFLGLRGEMLAEFRERVVIATYEARAQQQDHKAEIPDAVARHLM